MKKTGWIIATILFIITIIIGFTVGRVYWTEHNTALIEQGRAEMREQYARELDLNARIRRDIELRINKGVEKGVSEYAARFHAEQAKRMAVDEMARDRVEALIKADPDRYTNRLCVVPDQMLEERNRIRRNNGN